MRRLAILLAAQLPDDSDLALLALRYAEELVQGYAKPQPEDRNTPPLRLVQE